MELVITAIVLVLIFASSLVFAPQGWRTLCFNALAAFPPLAASIFGVLTGFDWTAVLSAKAAALAGLAVLVGNAILRTLTTGPVGNK